MEPWTTFSCALREHRTERGFTRCETRDTAVLLPLYSLHPVKCLRTRKTLGEPRTPVEDQNDHLLRDMK